MLTMGAIGLNGEATRLKRMKKAIHYSPYWWGSDTEIAALEVNKSGSTVEH
jgi:hypothetical protein